VERNIFKIKEQHQEELLRYENVIGIGIGNKVKGGKRLEELCIKVYVRTKKPKDQLSPDQVIPEEIEGFKTDVEEMEPPAALGGNV